MAGQDSEREEVSTKIGDMAMAALVFLIIVIVYAVVWYSGGE